MKSIALVTLDCEDGSLRRYLRVEGNKPEKTGEARINAWNPVSTDPDYWQRLWASLQAFRVGYVPPEDPTPRPTSPMRDQRERMAA